MVAIIDYDAGNIRSVEKAVESLGREVVLTRSAEQILSADHIILPGVGAFGDAMERLSFYGLIDVIKEAARRNKPLLGICLGQQLLFEESEESVGVAGLGLLRGKVRKIPTDGSLVEGSNRPLKVPNIGWNSLKIQGGKLFEGVKDGSFVYFVHSYYCRCEDRVEAKALIDYGVEIDASVERGNIFACQFHPEKSSDVGLKILENFLEL